MSPHGAVPGTESNQHGIDCCVPIDSLGSVRQKLEAGEFLFRAGDARDFIFKIEEGTIALFCQQIGRPNRDVRVAVAGEFVGLGCFEFHSEAGQSLSDSIVTRLTQKEFVSLSENSPQLKHVQTLAIERGFESRKQHLAAEGQTTPLERVAAFLVVLSRQNAAEGRDPAMIGDTLSCGLVADLLRLDIDTLGRNLVALQRMGLISPATEGCLSIRSVKRLEAFADGNDEPGARRRPIKASSCAGSSNEVASTV